MDYHDEVQEAVGTNPDIEYDHLNVIKSDTQVKFLVQDLAKLLAQSNPHHLTEVYIKDKVSKHQGILNAFNQRKQNIKNYVAKIEFRNMKQEKLQQSSAANDPSTRFELNNEI